MPLWGVLWDAEYSPWGWTNDWTHQESLQFWDGWAPVIAGGLALVATARIPRGVRARLLLAVGLLPLARAASEWVARDFGEDVRFAWTARSVLTLVALVGAGAAAGNHLRRRHPTSDLALRVTGVTGILLAILFGGVLAVVLIEALMSLGHMHRGSDALVLLACVASPAYVFWYGLLTGIRAKDPEVAARRSLFLARMGGAFLLLASLGVGLLDSLESSSRYGASDAPDSLAVFAARAIHTLFHEGGQLVLMALGIAAWFEPRVRKRSGPVDAETLEHVFG